MLHTHLLFLRDPDVLAQRKFLATIHEVNSD